MKQFFLLSASLVTFSHLYAQEMLGIVNSNFAGNVGLPLNPASVVGMPFTREFNIFSVDVSAHNNYLYYPAGEKGFIKLITGRGLGQGIASDYYTTRPDKQLYANVFLLGPSILRSSNSFGWAFHTAVRVNASVQDLNYHLAKFIWDGFDYAPQHNISYSTGPFQANYLQWYELGFTYGRAITQSKSGMLTAGATLNLNLGANAAYINNNRMDYVVPNSKLLVVNSISAVYGHTITDNSPQAIDYFSIKGFGAGINLGAQYYKDRNERAYTSHNRNIKKYTYKMGATLLDIGFIHFGQQANTVKFSNDSTFWPGIDTTKFQGLNDFDQLLNYQFTGTPDLLDDKNSFNMFLPGAASLQFDYNLYQAFYANATWVQRIGIFTPQIKRANQLTFTVRYETRNFEAAIPYSFYEYYKHRLGIALRYKWFFIGSDKLGPVLDLWDVDGIDFYLGIKLTSNKALKRTGGKNDCPAFQ